MVVVVNWLDQEGRWNRSEVLEDYLSEWIKDEDPQEYRIIGRKEGFGKQFR